MLARGVHPFYLIVHCFDLVVLLLGIFRVIPALIIVELGADFSEPRLIYDFIRAQVKRWPLVLAKEPTIAEMDIAVPS